MIKINVNLEAGNEKHILHFLLTVSNVFYAVKHVLHFLVINIYLFYLHECFAFMHDWAPHEFLEPAKVRGVHEIS